MNERSDTVTTGTRVLRGGAWNVASRVVPQTYLAVVSVAAARFLGPDDFGRQSFIAFAELSLIMLMTVGVPQALVRYVGDAMGRDDAAGARGLASWGWRVEFVGAVIAALVLASVAIAGSEPRAAWLLAAVVAAAGILTSAPLAFLNGLQRWRTPALVGLGTGAGSALATVVVLAAGAGIVGMFAVEAATAIVSLALIAGLARHQQRRLAPTPRRDSRLRREAIRYAVLASIATGLTFIIWRRSELYFLERFSTDAQIGFYSIAFAAAMVPTLIFQALAGVMLPAVATLYGAGETERIRSGFSRAVRLMLVMALPTTALALALGPELVPLLYGSGYDDVRPILLILLTMIPFVAVVNMSASLLGAIGRLKPMVVAGIAASVVDIGLALALIPSYDAVGAAIANVSAQLTVGIPVVVIAWRFIGTVRWQPSTVLRVALFSGIAGACAWGCVLLLGGVAGVAAGAVAGAVIFYLLAAALRILSADDAGWLDESLGRLLGGMAGRVIRTWAQPVARESAP